jgi:hypothetical protein
MGSHDEANTRGRELGAVLEEIQMAPRPLVRIVSLAAGLSALGTREPEAKRAVATESLLPVHVALSVYEVLDEVYGKE